MIWYLNLRRELKSQFISSLLALLKNFSLAILANVSIDIIKNNLIFYNQIVQGVCSCFSLFNFQGTSLLRSLFKVRLCNFIDRSLSRAEDLFIIAQEVRFVKN